jgi:uncharacterized protein YqeY
VKGDPLNLATQIDQDLKTALKTRHQLTVAALRMVKAALKNKQVELGRPLETDEALGVVAAQIKQRRDSADQYEKGGRPDLAQREMAELAVLEHYLPPRLDPDALEQAVEEAIAETNAQGPQDMGRVMKTLMARYKNQVDGKVVGGLVKQKLSAS